MEKLVIFGATQTGRKIYQEMKDRYHVVGFADNNASLWQSGTTIDGIPVIDPNRLPDMEFDRIVIASITGREDILTQLRAMGIQDSKFLFGWVELSLGARVMFLKRAAEELYRKGIPGSVAEAGVFRGEFAKEINRYFPDKKCYLFDTFEGFPEKNVMLEPKGSTVNGGHFKMTTEQVVYEKMPNKQMIEIRKGYFPETAADINCPFCFVNLDMDLYKPTYDGIAFFYPKLSGGGYYPYS